MPGEEDAFERAVARIFRSMLILGILSAGAIWITRGWAWAAGFALGAAAAWVNFRWMKQLVDALGGKRPRARLAVLLGLRYLLLGAGAYAILRYSAISLPAALAGLFVPAAAVIIEILFQLTYARN
jgi:hypothetical protein